MRSLATTTVACLLMAIYGARAEMVPQQVQSSILANYRDCAPPVREVPPEAVRSIDFNDDGKPDYIVDIGQFCQSYCGSAGCVHDIWVSQRGTWKLEFRGNIRGLEGSVRKHGKNVMLVDMYGDFCPERARREGGAAYCPKQLRWDGRKLLLENR